MRVDITQIIPAGTRPLGHGVRLAAAFHAGHRVRIIKPFLRLRKRRFAGSGRFEVLQIGQSYRQVILIDKPDRTVFHNDDGERLAPVTLTAEQPVAKFVIGHFASDSAGGKPVNRLRFRGFHIHAVDVKSLTVRAVDGFAVACPADFSRKHVGGIDLERGGFLRVRLNDALDRNMELDREIEVAGIVRGNRHDRAGTVRDQHIVGNPDGNPVAVDGIDGVSAGKDAGLFIVEPGSVEVAFGCNHLAVVLDRLSAFRRRDGVNDRVFGSEHHISRAEQRIGTRREDRHLLLCSVDPESDLRAFGLADPVALHLLDAFRPVEFIHIGKQTLRIFRDLEHPLPHGLADHGMVAAFAAPVDDLLIRKNGSEGGTPVHGDFRYICESFLIQL